MKTRISVTKNIIFILIAVSFLILTSCQKLSEKKEECNNIEGSLEKNTCYLDTNLENVFITNLSKENCYSIEDTYLQHVCLRVGFRPHMSGFMTKKDSKLNFENFLGECGIYDKYHSLYCTYLTVAKMAKIDTNKAEKICNQLEDEKLIGECNFYIVLSLVMNIKEETDKKIDFIMDFCSKVTYPSWKAECYYILADELSLINNSDYFIDISESCKESQLAKDYFCFHHVVLLMSLENAEEFCNLADEIGKLSCYVGLGNSFGIQFNNLIYNAIERCNNVSFDFRESCFKGLGDFVGHDFGYNASLGVEMCNKFPKEYKEQCFNSLGEFLGQHLNYDFLIGNKECDKFPIDFRESCKNDLTQAIGFYLGYLYLDEDILMAIKECNDIPVDFRESCFKGLGDFINRHLSDQGSLHIDVCNRFPEEYRKYCLKGLNQQV